MFSPLSETSICTFPSENVYSYFLSPAYWLALGEWEGSKEKEEPAVKSVNQSYPIKHTSVSYKLFQENDASWAIRTRSHKDEAIKYKFDYILLL